MPRTKPNDEKKSKIDKNKLINELLSNVKSSRVNNKKNIIKQNIDLEDNIKNDQNSQNNNNFMNSFFTQRVIKSSDEDSENETEYSYNHNKDELINDNEENNNIINIDENKIKKKYDEILKKYWGYENLKDEQFEIIKEIVIHRRNICAVLATGFGKSICYQLPHLINNKSIIVVSPLISLMNEQFIDLTTKGINVCVFNSNTSLEELKKHRKDIYDGIGKVIYMTPENIIKSESFIKKIENYLEMVAIDEAHAISTWGLDFRPSYTKLSVIKEWIPNVPILTLTATASTRVREDIANILSLKNHKLIMGNFDRPNLMIRVYKKHKEYPLDMFIFIEKYKKEYIIIYCNTKNKTDELASKIREKGINCESYHAGMSDIDRKNTQDKFIRGEVKCIVATIAFGMGINIPQVRLVLHFNCPKNIESYYQEIGRAGRDGNPSECVLFYSTKDFQINKFFIKNIQNEEQKKYQEQQIKKIEKYVFSNDCRRKLILENFGQHVDSCKKCDNCISKKKEKEQLINYTKQTYLILSILSKMNGQFGIGTNIGILLGRKAKLKTYMFDFDEYALGNSFGNEQYWKDLYRYLINDDYIKELQDGFYVTIGLTNKGQELYDLFSDKYTFFDDLVNDFDNISDKLIIKYPQIESITKINKKIIKK